MKDFGAWGFSFVTSLAHFFSSSFFSFFYILYMSEIEIWSIAVVGSWRMNKQIFSVFREFFTSQIHPHTLFNRLFLFFCCLSLFFKEENPWKITVDISHTSFILYTTRRNMNKVWICSKCKKSKKNWLEKIFTFSLKFEKSLFKLIKHSNYVIFIMMNLTQ